MEGSGRNGTQPPDQSNLSGRKGTSPHRDKPTVEKINFDAINLNAKMLAEWRKHPGGGMEVKLTGSYEDMEGVFMDLAVLGHLTETQDHAFEDWYNEHKPESTSTEV